MQRGTVYVRIVLEQIPDTQREKLSFREDRNYVLIHVDSEKNRMLIPDDKNRLVWVPIAFLRFVKVS